MTTTIHFSGLNTYPAFLIHLASDSRYWVGPQISLLPCWISFKQVGLVSLSVTHPLGNTCQFHPFEGNPKAPDLSRHEHFFVSYYYFLVFAHIEWFRQILQKTILLVLLLIWMITTISGSAFALTLWFLCCFLT